jgi:hypothetical protein
MTGPERRGHEGERVEPYGRPQDAPAAHVPVAAPAPSPGLDAATQAAIQAAAAAAAAAAIAQQQRSMQLVQPGLPGGPPASAPPAGLPGAAQGFVKVSGTSDPRKVAGKLAHTCRDNPAPAMLTIGSNCINQAVKAICIARGVRPCLLMLLSSKQKLFLSQSIRVFSCSHDRCIAPCSIHGSAQGSAQGFCIFGIQLAATATGHVYRQQHHCHVQVAVSTHLFSIGSSSNSSSSCSSSNNSFVLQQGCGLTPSHCHSLLCCCVFCHVSPQHIHSSSSACSLSTQTPASPLHPCTPTTMTPNHLPRPAALPVFCSCPLALATLPHGVSSLVPHPPWRPTPLLHWMRQRPSLRLPTSILDTPHLPHPPMHLPPTPSPQQTLSWPLALVGGSYLRWHNRLAIACEPSCTQ